MNDLAKLRALRGPERRLLLFCVAATPVVAAGVAILGLRRTQAIRARWSPPRIPRFRTEREAEAWARSAGRIVAIAAGRGPIRVTCLRQSLLLWWLLRREGLEAVLRVGVQRQDETLSAHAWVEYLGRPVNDAEDIAVRFPPFEQDIGGFPERVP